MRIAINGFGRIGRLILRAIVENKLSDIEVVAINDLQSMSSSVHLLKYDSVHGIFNGTLKETSNNTFSVDGREINYYSMKDPANLPWKHLGIDLVMECTGRFKTEEKCFEHLKAGAKKVLLSCPGTDEIKTIVFGVNDDTLDRNQDVIISSGSCTTNCLAPIVKVLNSEFGIAKGSISTIHSYTADQRLTDASHKDLRRARAAALNIIPTTTGAASTIEKIFPELTGKMSGVAFRVPTPNVSLLDCSFLLTKSVEKNEVEKAIIDWSGSNFKPNVLGYSNDNLVSSDFTHSLYSSVVDLPLLKVIDGNLVQIISWYDNEWGFANRMLDNACLLF